LNLKFSTKRDVDSYQKHVNLPNVGINTIVLTFKNLKNKKKYEKYNLTRDSISILNQFFNVLFFTFCFIL